jgi:hypothetical protein
MKVNTQRKSNSRARWNNVVMPWLEKEIKQWPLKDRMTFAANLSQLAIEIACDVGMSMNGPQNDYGDNADS